MIKRSLKHLFVSFRHHASLMLVTVLVLTASFSVIGGLLLTGKNLQSILTLWGESLQMSVYLKDESTSDQVESLSLILKNDERIGKAEWVGKDKALTVFQDQLASYAPDLLKDPQLLKFIPQSFQIQLSDKVSSALQLDTLRALANDLKGNSVVEEVSYGQEWVKTYSEITRTLSSLGFWMMLLLASASIFVISNSVSSSIQQRKNEIEVLELVGATTKFIRTPFLFEGLFVGFISGFFSVVLLVVGFSLLKEELRTHLSFIQVAEHLQFFSPFSCLLFLGATMGVGFLSAHLSLRKLNSGWLAAQAKSGR